DPADPVPTIGGNYCAVGEFPAQGEGMEPMWMRLLNPALMLRNIMTPGPADQKEAEEFFTARQPGRRLSERDDVLVERVRHRLHREADRRVPAERGLSRGLRHADQRLRDPLPLPQRLRVGGAH